MHEAENVHIRSVDDPSKAISYLNKETNLLPQLSDYKTQSLQDNQWKELQNHSNIPRKEGIQKRVRHKIVIDPNAFVCGFSDWKWSRISALQGTNKFILPQNFVLMVLQKWCKPWFKIVVLHPPKNQWDTTEKGQLREMPCMTLQTPCSTVRPASSIMDAGDKRSEVPTKFW